MAEQELITRKWLKKLGFVEDWMWQLHAKGAPYDVFKYSANEKYAVLVDTQNKWGYVEFFLQPNSKLPYPKLRYVHELQNLFYYFTGEQLTVKDNG